MYQKKLTQDYEKTEKRGPPIFGEKVQMVTQDISWGIYRTEKFDQVMEKIFPPENTEDPEINKVNFEIWRDIKT